MTDALQNVVFSGGGVRGVVYCGVFKALIEEGVQGIKRVSCVSIGSMFGLLYVLGIHPEEIQEEILTKDFTTLRDIRFSKLQSKYGIDSGDGLMRWLYEVLTKRGIACDITFRTLYEQTGIHFAVHTTNLVKMQLCTFDHINTPNVDVVSAIRMSISIPFMFFAKRYRGDIHVDGGVIDNYPIKMFDGQLDQTIGFHIVSSDGGEINDIYNFTNHVMTCIMHKRDKYEQYRRNTVQLFVNMPSISFDLSRDDKMQLIDIGYTATKEYFKKIK